MSDASFIPGGWNWPSDLPAEHENEIDHEFVQKDQPHPKTDAGPASEVKDEKGQSEAQPPQSSDSDQKHWRVRTCRICLEEVAPTFNPPNENLPGFLAGRPYVSYESENGRLIRPCKCKGSSKYVHEQCLQEWRHADRSYTSQRHYWQCPTCGFKYRLERLTWARYISSAGSYRLICHLETLLTITAAQVALTLAIFFVAVFLLGFIGDFVINLYLDPVDVIASIPFGDQDDYAYRVLEEEDSSWLEHFLKGFASLGLLGFMKVFFFNNPLRWIMNRPTVYVGRGRRAGATGRDRISDLTWITIMVGVATVLYVSQACAVTYSMC